MVKIIQDELSARRPLRALTLPVGATDEGGADIAGRVVYIPMVSLPGEDVVGRAVSFGRPADTSAYAVGDLIANSTTAGNVAPLAFDVGVSKGLIRSGSIKSSNPALASSLSFRLHLWSQAPAVTGGDNAAVFAAQAALVSSSGYLGFIDITVDTWFSDGASGRGVPSPDIHFDLGAGTVIYGLIEARSAFTPTSAATLTAAIAGLAS